MSVPAVFSPVLYEIVAGNKTMRFGFSGNRVRMGFENGFLCILVEQENLDLGNFPDVLPEELDKALRTVKKDDFLKIGYSCYCDDEKTDFLELLPLSVLFEDLETGSARAVRGDGFYNLEPAFAAQRPAAF